MLTWRTTHGSVACCYNEDQTDQYSTEVRQACEQKQCVFSHECWLKLFIFALNSTLPLFLLSHSLFGCQTHSDQLVYCKPQVCFQLLYFPAPAPTCLQKNVQSGTELQRHLRISPSYKAACWSATHTCCSDTYFPPSRTELTPQIQHKGILIGRYIKYNKRQDCAGKIRKRHPRGEYH